MYNKKVFKIDNFPWDGKGYKPETTVEMSYDDTEYDLYFETNETDIKAVQKKHNTDVHLDSCVEAFIQFLPDKDDSYINFEINPNGAMRCAKGINRYNRVEYPESVINNFKIKTQVDKNGWKVWFKIPVEFIKKEYPQYVHKEKKRIRANFYKCGDNTKIPHWGCWNNIDCDHPDFHLSGFFGEIEL